MFLRVFFIKVKKTCFMFFNVQINVFNIYGYMSARCAANC